MTVICLLFTIYRKVILLKILSRVIDIVLVIIVIISVSAAIVSAVLKKPFLLTAVRSNSMYPLFRRGDILFISPVAKNTKLNVGDIIVFDPKEGSLASKGDVVHRIYSGNEAEGFITKGDANSEIDQSSKGDSLIKKEWVSNRVITISKHPLKIPLLGFVPLYMEKIRTNSFLLPVLAVVLAAIIAVYELKNPKRKQKKSKLEMQFIYFFSGITVSVTLAASMLTLGQHLKLEYIVSDSGSGLLSGSDVGVIKTGEIIEKPLSTFSNKGLLPMVCVLSAKDKQVSFNHEIEILDPKHDLDTTYIVNASTPGEYSSDIDIGMFYPLLPKKIISLLAKESYWLTLIVISIIPGLPIMLYPLFDPKMRHRTFKVIRSKFKNRLCFG